MPRARRQPYFAESFAGLEPTSPTPVSHGDQNDLSFAGVVGIAGACAAQREAKFREGVGEVGSCRTANRALSVGDMWILAASSQSKRLIM